MQPIAETEEVDRQYGPFSFRGEDLLEYLMRIGERVETLAPDCVGLSLSVEAEHGITFTLESPQPRGVATTLSFALSAEGESLGDLHLYGATLESFRDQRGELVEALGAGPSPARVDADLAFTTREQARQAPYLVWESTCLSLAAALVSRARGLPFNDADLRLRAAADQAAIPVASLAQGIIAVLSDV